MKVGYGRVEITPSMPFYLLGYKTPLRNEPAKGIHDSIFINGLLIKNDLGDEVFIATGDLLEIEDSVAAEIRNKISNGYKIPFENIIIGVTHDHHSVRDFHKSWEYGKFNQEYYDFFVDSFVTLFENCRSTMVDAQLQYGEDLVLGYYGNRNHKGKQSDNVVSVVKVISNGKEIAGLVNIAVHSTVLSGNNTELTADLAGTLSSKLKEQWGFYPLMLIGCAADSSNHHERLGRDFDELDRVASALANKIGQIEVNKEVMVDNQRLKVLTLCQEVISDKKTYDNDLREKIEAMEMDQLDIVGSQPKEHLIQKCENQLKQAQFYDVVPFSILDMGELRIFTFPGELASVGGQVLRDSTSKTVLVAGYSNGFHHYFLEKEEYGRSFETIGNPVPRGTFEMIIDKFICGGKLLD